MGRALPRLVVQLLVRVVAPPGRYEDLLQALRTVQHPARLDRGCVSADIWRGTEDDRLIGYVEEWTDADDLGRQLAAERIGRLLAVLETAAEPPVVEVRLVSEARGLEYIAAARGEAASSGVCDGKERGSVPIPGTQGRSLTKHVAGLNVGKRVEPHAIRGATIRVESPNRPVSSPD